MEESISFSEFSRSVKDNRFQIKVLPNASRTKLIIENNALKLYLKSEPVKGKANIELIKFFKKEYKLKVSVLSGLSSKMKVIQILEQRKN